MEKQIRDNIKKAVHAMTEEELLTLFKQLEDLEAELRLKSTKKRTYRPLRR